jgi:hypothetical protein
MSSGTPVTALTLRGDQLAAVVGGAALAAAAATAGVLWIMRPDAAEAARIPAPSPARREVAPVAATPASLTIEDVRVPQGGGGGEGQWERARRRRRRDARRKRRFWTWRKCCRCNRTRGARRWW